MAVGEQRLTGQGGNDASVLAADGDEPGVFYNPELGVSVDLGDDEEEPVLHRLISDRKAIAEEAEFRRLLYVALTRAGDHLF